MKIKLIAPARKDEWGESFWDLKTLCNLTGRKAAGTPLALPTLAALTPPDIDVSIVDENIEPIDFDEKIDLVGITFFTALAPRAYEIADIYRMKKIPVVLGGIHASMLPDEAKNHADAVVVGEAEELWPEVIHDFKKDILKQFYKADNYPVIKNSPKPRWDLVKTENYCYFTVQTGRGCPYNCDFCSVHIFNGRKKRHKNIENVIEEVKLLKKIDPRKAIFFTDDNILANLDYSTQLFKALKPMKVKWWCQSSINKLKDNKILDLMYESGCREVFIGIESLSQDSLKYLNKNHTNIAEEYKEVIENIHNHGIAVFASFIIGSDYDDESMFEEILNFVEENNISFSMVNILTPTPGTKLFQQLESENRLKDLAWWKYDGEYICFSPKNLSEESLKRGRNELHIKINSYKMLSKRFNNLWNKGVFLRNRDTAKATLFTKGRFLFTIKSLFSGDIRKMFFTVKGLWNPKITSITSISLALSFHDYAASLLERDIHE